MTLFQNSILKSYKQDESLIALRWAKYQNYLAKVEAIKDFKEEEYQDGFLHDIFEECLGYTLKTSNPNAYNLEREKKNETNGQKADGAILVDEKVVAVIELKDQKTKDLDKKYNREESAIKQAFGYLNYNNHAEYVIVSNFDELRFYFNKATAYEGFYLFHLDFEGFRKLHLLLSYESISINLPITLKQESDIKEQQISKELYKDFSAFRMHLFENIVQNNTHAKAHLLRLTQKLCDRIIFILFAEDRKLLTESTINEIRTRHKADGFGDRSMYDYYKLYFNAINTGNEKLNIPKYNGGLFAVDAELDALKIDDEVLDMEAQKLSDYDFESEVSVNILGHIFEQSLTDLEELQANIEHVDFDKKNTKRKKDGVFYTPEYITKYIVENTLTKLCEEKKEEFGIQEIHMPNNTKKLTKEDTAHKEKLLAYRTWLHELKILDPACGSGAFLNQALEFLIKEHVELRNFLLPYEDLTLGYEVEKEILENNLYGVDINEDAVEIARLSLWLRTAHKGRELTSLAEKIKCGNSLIDDKSVAENAFDWHVEFPEVFAKGGFDVVIGNPPYITFALGKKQDFQSKDIEYYKNTFPMSSAYKVSSYLIFIEQSLKLISNNGLLSFIVPNTLYTNYFYANFREYLIENFSIHKLLNLPYEVFEEADTGGSSIFILGKQILKSSQLFLVNNEKEFVNLIGFAIEQKEFINIPDNKFLFSDNLISLWKKSFINSIALGNNNFQFYNGIKTGDNNKFLSEMKIDDKYKPIIRGRDFYKYTPLQNELFVLFDPKQLWSNTNEAMYLVDEKLIFRQTSDHLVVTYDNLQKFTMDTTHILFDKSQKFNHKYLLVVLNSKLLNFLYQIIVPEIGKAFSEVKGVNLKQLPIKEILESEQIPFIQKADKMLELNKNLQETKQNFLNELKLEKLTKKLQNFEELTFEEFIAEYTKALKLKFPDKLAERYFKQEWQAIFENDKILACGYKTEIQITDKEIDKMVYELYGLSEDEIKIVEGNK